MFLISIMVIHDTGKDHTLINLISVKELREGQLITLGTRSAQDGLSGAESYWSSKFVSNRIIFAETAKHCQGIIKTQLLAFQHSLE